MKSEFSRIVMAVLGLVIGFLWWFPAAGEQTIGPVTLGADLRLRQVYIDDVGLLALSPSADRNFQRLRLRGWGRYDLGEHLTVAARLIWEGRHYALPPKSGYRIPGFEPWWSGDILFDHLTLDLKRIGNRPFSLKMGRQDLALGNGWLVLEGTPLDGSRTLYMDAARATYVVEGLGTTVDLIYLNNNPSTWSFPYPLTGGAEDQVEQYETGGILYLRNKSLLRDTDLDGYAIYKGNHPNDTPGNLRINNGAPFPSPADDGEIYALGGRIDTKLDARWGLRAEVVGEWGTSAPYPGAPREDLAAFGFNGRLLHSFNDRLANRLHLDLEVLSGDDPDSSQHEAFDPLWGRWPQWSELMIYQWALDSRVGEATNLTRLNLGWMAKPHATTEVTLDYHALWANQESVRVPTSLYGNLNQSGNISHDGRFRGHLFTGWIKTRFNRYLSGHLMAEYLAPGDFYAGNRQDDSYFLRAEVVLTY